MVKRVGVLVNEQKNHRAKGGKGFVVTTTASSSLFSFVCVCVASNISIILRLIRIKLELGQFDSYSGGTL